MKLKPNPRLTIITVILLGVSLFSSLALQRVLASTNEPLKIYDLDYTFSFLPDDKSAHVTIRLSNNAGLIKRLSFNFDPVQHIQFEGDGEVKIEANNLTWHPPKEGGSLSYRVKIDRKRDSGTYNAYFSKDWAIFRGEHLVPSVKVVTKPKAESRAQLRFNIPAGWAAATAYEPLEKFNFAIDNPQRRFDRPKGWMAVGNMGIRKEQILNTHVVVAGPKYQGIRRQDIIAFLNWNLPELVAVFPDFYQHFLIVSAGDPMWRGGLSGPGSFYIHKDRPMISGNGTSTLIHELVHTAMRINGGDNDDWIVEGFAEFYSLEIMRRSGTISERRYKIAMSKLQQWGTDIKKLRVKRSHGPITARAVLLMKELDNEIKKITGNTASLDDVVRVFAREQGKVSLAQLRRIAKEVAGTSLKSLSTNNSLLAD